MATLTKLIITLYKLKTKKRSLSSYNQIKIFSLVLCTFKAIENY